MSGDILGYREFYRRNLPHYQPESGVFSVTYRLDFPLAKHIVEKISSQKIEFAKYQSKIDESKRYSKAIDFQIKQFFFIDDYLGLCRRGHKYLSNPGVANVVAESLLYMNGIQYELFCYCIMPNHVHVLLKPIEKEDGSYYSLAEIMKGHKGSTARRTNILLNRKGRFWHAESYDHLVRSQQEFENTVWYIVNNPVKARLVDDYRKWKHYWVKESIREDLSL